MERIGSSIVCRDRFSISCPIFPSPLVLHHSHWTPWPLQPSWHPGVASWHLHQRSVSLGMAAKALFVKLSTPFLASMYLLCFLALQEEDHSRWSPTVSYNTFFCSALFFTSSLVRELPNLTTVEGGLDCGSVGFRPRTQKAPYYFEVHVL